MSIRPGYLATSALMLLAMLAASAHLRAADSVVAKIVATRVTGRTTSADVRVYQGTLVAGEVDILSPGGKATATLALPKGKGQATAGETVTREIDDAHVGRDRVVHLRNRHAAPPWLALISQIIGSIAKFRKKNPFTD